MGEFSVVFKSLRQRERLSQQELGEKLGIAKSTISMYENGNREPDLETLEKIADFFNVDMNYLLGHARNTTKLDAASQYVPTYEDMQKLIARNGKKLSFEEKMELIKLLSELR